MQCGRVAPNIFEAIALIHLPPERAVFLLEFAPLHRVRNQQFDFVQIERLGDKIVGAAFHRFDRDIDGTVCRHHDADGSTRHFQGAIDQGHSIFAAEAQVGEENVDLLAFEHIDRAGDICCDIHVILILEQLPKAVPSVLLVIDNEDGGLNEVHVENAAILDRPAHSDFEKCFFSSETGMTRNLPALTSRFVNVCNEKSISALLGQTAASDSARSPTIGTAPRGLAEFDAASSINNIFGGRWIA